MNKFALRTSASLLALALGGGAASAQDVESVTVTGVRAAVDSALGIKKNASQLMDSIVAEDIGKLPDSTVVESLQHVTGVAIIRNSYEPSTVLIRGLPDVQTLLNGRQIFTSTGRTISLPDFPSELLSRVDVHKASSATDISGGIAGLIDVHLHRPFDFDGFVMAGGLQVSYGTLAGVPDPNASFLISDRWKTDAGEFGLLLDVSYRPDHARRDQINPGSGNQRNVASAGPVAGATNGPGPVCLNGAACSLTNVTHTSGIRAGYADLYAGSFNEQYGKNERGAMNLAAQWRPTETVEAFAEMFYTRQRNSVTADVLVGQTNACNDAGRTTVFPNTNFAQQIYSSCYSITSDQPNHSKEDTYNIATGATWNVTERFTLSTEFSATSSKSSSVSDVLDTAFNYGTDGLHTILSYNGTGGTYIDMPGNELAKGPFYFAQFYDNFSDARGSAWDGRIDGNYDFGPGSFIRNLEFGYRYNRRNAHNRGAAGGGLACTNSNPGNPASGNNKYLVAAYNSPACSAFRAQSTPSIAAINAPLQQTSIHIGGIPLENYAGAVHCSHGTYFNGDFGIQQVCDADPTWLQNNIETVRNLFGYSGRQDLSPAKSYIVSEASSDAYIKVDYAFDVYGFPVDGNFGGRMVDTILTQQTANATVIPTTDLTCTTCILYTPVVAQKETNDFLPSLNLRVTLADDLFFRFAASRTLTRPSFTQTNPSQNITNPTANIPGSISSGNANLAPEKSTNLDADLEYYWGHGNHLNAAVFHRDVSGYIQTLSGNTVIGGIAYTTSQPVNALAASLEGAEAGYSQFLDFLPGFWSGFGWDVNATYISGVFQNISHWHANVAGIYEKGPYSVRVSYTYSTGYNQGNFTTALPPINWVAPRSNLDASFNYNWNDHVTLTLDATNISNSRFRAYGHALGGDTSFEENVYASDLQQYDRVISVGVRYRM